MMNNGGMSAKDAYRVMLCDGGVYCLSRFAYPYELYNLGRLRTHNCCQTNNYMVPYCKRMRLHNYLAR